MTVPAPEMTEYARRRLSGRATGAMVMAVFVVGLTVARLAGPHSVTEDILGLIVGLAVAANVVAWILPVHPSTLTRVAWPRDGSWRAAMPLTQFEQVVASRPRARGDALLMGRITFDADGATFSGGKGATRAYGLLDCRLGSGEIFARRLRGWGGQGHLMLLPADGRSAPIDVWIWGSKTFPLETPR